MAAGDRYATHATKALLGPRKNRISRTIKPTDDLVKYAEKTYIDLQFLKILKQVRGES